MKKFLSVPVSLLLIICLCNVKSTAQSSDETMVRAVIQKAEDAWNAHDYSYTGKYDLFAPDAVLVNPVGMYWKNRSEILTGIQHFGPMMFRNTSSKYNIRDVRFLAPTAALVVVHSIDRVDQDFNLPDGSKGGSKGDVTESMYTYTLIKRNGDWKISSLQVTGVNTSAAASNPVQNK